MQFLSNCCSKVCCLLERELYYTQYQTFKNLRTYNVKIWRTLGHCRQDQDFEYKADVVQIFKKGPKRSKEVQKGPKRSKKYAYVIYEWPKRNDVDPRHSANAWIISKKIEIKFLDFINVHSLQTPKTMQ